ncbi:hypothetical protein EAH72_35045 [Pseudomonas caspiana]|nr:hypothetical protein EAH72_35045 [Pseudomonas caspiana]
MTAIPTATGFLANRVCGEYLPTVYEALKMAAPVRAPNGSTFAIWHEACRPINSFRDPLKKQSTGLERLYLLASIFEGEALSGLP